MDFERLREIDEWFRTRWLIFALAALAEKPLSYSDLRRAVRQHTATRITDSSLNRLLDQLLGAGLATRTTIRTRTWRAKHLYTLTEEGRAAVAKIDTITEALRAHCPSDDSDPESQPTPAPD